MSAFRARRARAAVLPLRPAGLAAQEAEAGLEIENNRLIDLLAYNFCYFAADRRA